METDRPDQVDTSTIQRNKIAAERKKRGWSQQRLAEAVGAHWVTISNLERGKAPLTFEWLERLGAAMKMDWAELTDVEPKERIFLNGSISEGILDLHETEPYELDASVGIWVINAWWVLVADADLYPAFQRGDLLRIVSVDLDDPKDVDACIGRMCVISDLTDPALDEGPEFGYLGRGDELGTWNLTRINKPPLKNLKATFIGLVDRALFRPRLPKLLVEWLETHQREREEYYSANAKKT